jgi:hypothetical protein
MAVPKIVSAIYGVGRQRWSVPILPYRCYDVTQWLLTYEAKFAPLLVTVRKRVFFSQWARTYPGRVLLHFLSFVGLPAAGTHPALITLLQPCYSGRIFVFQTTQITRKVWLLPYLPQARPCMCYITNTHTAICTSSAVASRTITHCRNPLVCYWVRNSKVR